METQITIKMTPAEYDLLRDAVLLAESDAMGTALDRSLPVRTREKSRTRAVKLNDLLRKMK